MVEIEQEGLFLIEGTDVIHIHTSAGEKDLDRLEKYLNEWDLEIP